MKFSEQWLRELVAPAVNTDTLVECITMAGLEVDAVESACLDFSQVVVAEIVQAEPHPNADKLQICQVSTGSETFQVVCGAPNARAGLKTAFAMVGAVLPDGEGGSFKIKKAKLRQIESFGMLCAGSELGLSADAEGIMELAGGAHIGVNLREYLQLNDNIIDVDLTPNRADCLSIKGLAREVGTLFKTQVRFLDIKAVESDINARFSTSISAAEDCPRLVTRVIKEVNVKALTPLWMQEKLRRAGVRSIDAVVDITNYVLQELGQPMHAYDLAQLDSALEVRKAKQDETLSLLDGQEVTLNSDTLVIADAKSVVSIAGIMGGSASSVTDKTQDILLEAAFFNPISIAGRARSYGLHTDSSHRFERGVDWQLQTQAIERATALILEICGGRVGPLEEVCHEQYLPEQAPILLRQEKVNSYLAFAMPAAEIEEILMRLGLKTEPQKEGEWLVTVPSYRFDISLEVDLIEELARVYGYNNLPVSLPQATLPFKADDETKISLNSLRRTLVARGYQEAITYSFIAADVQQQFDPEQPGLAVANPISAEMAVMRTSLWPGLVKTLEYNQNRQQQRVRLFETGQRFIPQSEQLADVLQENVLAGLISGSRTPEGWTGDQETVDFFDAKADLEAMLALAGAADEFSFIAAQHPALHPGQNAAIQRAGKTVGYLGALHPSLVKDLGLSSTAYVFEIALDRLLSGSLPKYQSLSKFPESRRDLALLVDQQIAFADLRAAVIKHAGQYLQEVRLFDMYQGKAVESGKKSLALGLIWQHPSSTLNEDEIKQSVEAVTQALADEFKAVLRD